MSQINFTVINVMSFHAAERERKVSKKVSIFKLEGIDNDDERASKLFSTLHESQESASQRRRQHSGSREWNERVIFPTLKRNHIKILWSEIFLIIFKWFT